MYTLLDADPILELHAAAVSSAAAKLVSLMQPAESGCVIPAGSDIAQLSGAQSSFFLLKDGNYSYTESGKLLYFYNDGDLIGLEEVTSTRTCEIKSDFGTVCDRYAISDLLNQSSKDSVLLRNFYEYFAHKVKFLNLLSSRFLHEEVSLSPEIKYFESGDIILRRGDPADLVYTLIEGAAHATVDNVKVGEIGRDEIFGVIAVVTNTPRSATVTAVKRCMTAAVPKEHFIRLIHNKPQTILKLVEDMARTIVALNEQVVTLQKDAKA